MVFDLLRKLKVQGLGFSVSGLGSRVPGLPGFGLRGFGFLCLRVLGFRFSILVLGVLEVGFRVSGVLVGFWELDLRARV